MNKISAVIVAKNEEEVIEECIRSVSFCDEVVVINNSSSDKTAELAKNLGAKVIDVDSNSFSELRNKGKEESSNEWIFYIDADERVSLELSESIKKAKEQQDVDAYKVYRKNYYLGRNEWPKIEEMERLFLKSSLKRWQGDLHETPVFEGKIAILPGYLFHFTHRDLAQMLEKTIDWSDIEAKNRLEAGHPKMSWWRFIRVMATTFINYYLIQRGWRLGTAGLIESIYQSFSTFITYAKLWELQKRKNSNNLK